MVRRLTAAAVLAAAASLAAPGTALADMGCPPGTYERPTGFYSPLTGKPINYCAIIWPA